METTEYSVTVSVPFGISQGRTFDTHEEAQAAFDAAAAGTYPNGTDVTFWSGDDVQVATVTEETKAAARAEASATLDAIVAKANERAAARFAAAKA